MCILRMIINFAEFIFALVFLCHVHNMSYVDYDTSHLLSHGVQGHEILNGINQNIFIVQK